MIVTFAEVSPQVVDELDGEDFMALSVIVVNLYGQAKHGNARSYPRCNPVSGRHFHWRPSDLRNDYCPIG